MRQSHLKVIAAVEALNEGSGAKDSDEKKRKKKADDKPSANESSRPG